MSWGGRKIGDLRRLVVETYGLRCWLCLNPIDPARPHLDPLSLTIDHVVPRSKGGSDDLANLRPCHRRCNLRRGARSPSTVRPPRRRELGARFFGKAP